MARTTAKKEAEIEREQKKNEKRDRTNKILEMAKHGIFQLEIAKKVGLSQPRVSKIMQESGIIAADTIRKMLREYYANPEAEEISDEEWANRTGVYPETIARFKKKIVKRNEKGKERKDKRERIIAEAIELAKQGIVQTEIAKRVGCSQTRVSIYMKENGIMAVDKIRKMLIVYYANPEVKEISDEEWANRTSVYPETIARLRGEINKEPKRRTKKEVSSKIEATPRKKPETATTKATTKVVEPVETPNVTEREANVRKSVNNAKTVTNPVTQGVQPKMQQVRTRAKSKDEFTSKFLFLAKRLTDPHLIVIVLGISMSEVHDLLRYYRIFNRSQVVTFLDSETDEIIAAKGGLSVEAVKRVRRQEAAKNTPEAKELEFRKQKVIAIKKRQEAEPIFISLARRFEEIEKIGSKLNCTPWQVTLLLRKHGIASRNEIERMIENNPNMPDKEIAVKGKGSEHSVAKIREEIKERDKLIKPIPQSKQEEIIRMLDSQTAVEYISYKLNVTEAQVKALGKKWRRDSELRVSAKRKQVDFTILINEIRFSTKNSRRNINKEALQLRIQRALALYPDFLTSKEYALMANACIQAGCYFEGVELCENYLGLRSSTLKDAMKRIIEVVEQELPEKEMLADKSNIDGEAR